MRCAENRVIANDHVLCFVFYVFYNFICVYILDLHMCFEMISIIILALKAVGGMMNYFV